MLASDERAAVLAQATGQRGGLRYAGRYVLLCRIDAGRIQAATLLNEDQHAFDAFWA